MKTGIVGTSLLEEYRDKFHFRRTTDVDVPEDTYLNLKFSRNNLIQ